MRAQRYAASDRAVKGGHAGTVEGIAAVGLALTLACSQVWMRYVNRDGKTAVTGVGDFFFQAGDGIRDLTVTGVQTCALPILEADDFLELVGEFGIVGELERAHPMRLQPVPLPDAAHRGRADPHRLGHRWRAPMGRLMRRRSEELTSELQSQSNLVCRLLLEKK